MPVGPGLSSSTNAVLIDASKSGGLIMEAGDANFVASATVAGSSGATIIGSATAGNVLGGLIGNDVFTTSKAAGVADTVYTGGGADKVNFDHRQRVGSHRDLLGVRLRWAWCPGSWRNPDATECQHHQRRRRRAVGMVGSGDWWRSYRL